MIDLSWWVINEEEKRAKEIAEEEGYEYEPLFSLGTLFDIFSTEDKEEK